MSELQSRFPVYSRLLKLYPASYQKRYTTQMLQTLADMLDASTSAHERTMVWLRVFSDLPVSLFTQQLNYAGTALTKETPRFVQRNSVLSGLFFVPFFVIVIANDILSHRFYHSWLWHFDVLMTWIVVLPSLGLLLSVTTLLIWLRTSVRPWWRSLRDVGHNWMMLAPIVLGSIILLLVFFHDSTHCITGNPIRELHNPHDTLRCIEQR